MLRPGLYQWLPVVAERLTPRRTEPVESLGLWPKQEGDQGRVRGFFLLFCNLPLRS